MLSTAGFSILLRSIPIYFDFVRKGGTNMRECNDPNVDLEDLIFDEDAGGPSER
jgi:hypothetical protein